jgi:hypothetical protein
VQDSQNLVSAVDQFLQVRRFRLLTHLHCSMFLKLDHEDDPWQLGSSIGAGA